MRKRNPPHREKYRITPQSRELSFPFRFMYADILLLFFNELSFFFFFKSDPRNAEYKRRIGI